jgi:hypothetical protein
MGSLFKKQYTKPLPEGAELFERKGESFARWRDRRDKLRTASVTTGEGGTPRLLLESAAWYARFRDHAGLVVEHSTDCRDEAAARLILAKGERDAERIKAGYATPGEEQMARQLETPLADDFEAYDRSLVAGDVTEIHRTLPASAGRRMWLYSLAGSAT